MRGSLVACAVVVAALGLSAAVETPKGPRGLVGTWTLMGAERIDGSAPVAIPLPRGTMIFDSAGHVIEIVTRAGRKPFAVGRPTPEEALEAFNTFAGFWGSYRADEKSGLMTYRPEGAVNPSLMGQDLVRGYQLEGDHLTITSRSGESNLEGVMRWKWERIPPMVNLDATYKKVLGFWQWAGERVVATATGDVIREGQREPSVIVYSPSGLCAVHFLPPPRKRLAGQMATAEEAQAAIAGYIGYTAILTLHPNLIIHQQLFPINPSTSGPLERTFELIGDNEIHLNLLPIFAQQGREQQMRVTMKRLSGADEMLGN